MLEKVQIKVVIGLFNCADTFKSHRSVPVNHILNGKYIFTDVKGPIKYLNECRCVARVCFCKHRE